MPTTHARPSIVVVDDHHGLLQALTDALEHHDWTVKAFDSVEDALPYIRERLPDAVLTDINVGVLSGAALARELRLDRATAMLPIVGMSGTCDPSPAMLRLFDLFLQKPVELTQLDATLRPLVASELLEPPQSKRR